jgi:hypothetical protein
MDLRTLPAVQTNNHHHHVIDDVLIAFLPSSWQGQHRSPLEQIEQDWNPS